MRDATPTAAIARINAATSGMNPQDATPASGPQEGEKFETATATKPFANHAASVIHTETRERVILGPRGPSANCKASLRAGLHTTRPLPSGARHPR